MTKNPYELLAERLDRLPNGFPATPDGSEHRLLSYIFTPEEAILASRLRVFPETSDEIAARFSQEYQEASDPGVLQDELKSMARKGLIRAEKTVGGLGFAALPFVVGIFEMQISRMDETMARLFEDYYRQAFGQIMKIQPQFHRIIPVNESVRMDMEIHPYESASQIVSQAQAWGVLDCICRKQKALIGDPCEHPVDICMALHHRPGVFDNKPDIRALTMEEALDTLTRAANAGLVHSVSNNQEGITYICNCCTCSCGILRGMAELGIANVVARSAFVNQVDEELCTGCELCSDSCQFEALTFLDGLAQIDVLRCVGCGVCVPVCPDGALGLVRRNEEDILPVPVNIIDWGMQRAQSRHLDLRDIL